MTINLSDNLSQTNVHPIKNSFELKSDINSTPDGKSFGHLMSDFFQSQTASPTEMDLKEKSLAEKPGQEIADPFKMEGQKGVFYAQAMPLQAVALKAVTLGPHMSVITPETAPPDSQSLKAFARAQGLDENAINWLFGNHAGTVNATMISKPDAHVVTVGSAIGAPETMANVHLSPPQAPLAIQTSAAQTPTTATAHWQTMGLATSTFGHAVTTTQSTATAHGQTMGLAAHNLGHAATTAQSSAAADWPTMGLAAHNLGHSVATAQTTASADWPTTGLAAPAVGHAVTTAQTTATANGQTTGLTTPLVGLAMTTAQALWAMAEAPDRTPKPTVTPSTDEVPPLQLMRMAPPAAVWMQRNVNPSALQHNERAPKEAPISLSELDLGSDWGGETLEQLLSSAGAAQSTGTQGTAYANFASRWDAPANHRNDPPNPSGPSPDLPDFNARSENIQNLADKMGQAVGQRILSEMERGQWHLKLSLRPATLGHIEVEMKMRSGEFDAVFTAPNAVTRELLQEGLGKLKETLNQMGMNFAHINVGDGKSGKNGENPTPGSFRGQSASTDAGRSEVTLEKISRAPSVNDSAEGLDILV